MEAEYCPIWKNLTRNRRTLFIKTCIFAASFISAYLKRHGCAYLVAPRMCAYLYINHLNFCILSNFCSGLNINAYSRKKLTCDYIYLINIANSANNTALFKFFHKISILHYIWEYIGKIKLAKYYNKIGVSLSFK